ncbi:MAG: MBOAT family O-acyltransferase [Hyphomonas sp.]
MLFNSVPFLAYFLPVVVVVALLLGRAGQKEACKVWLLLASAFFYGYWAWPYLFLLFGTIIVNFFTGKMLSAPDRAQGQRRAIMIASVSFNLGLLFVFKYFNFFIENIDFLFGFDIQVFKVILPLGISFFTFQQIAFLADAYQRKLDEGYSFVDYALFISFFPQLIAGPIVHHKDLVPQFKSGLFARPTSEMFASGVAIIIIGLFKKAVLADSISPAVNTLFGEAAAGAHLTLMEAWLATLGFAGQIYFDFSGYSDIAIGLALLFGLRMPENFRAPYRAISIVEFWRRWHITLSDFLRDYLYIPLGGNRRGKVRRYINLMTTMLLGGLWHGAAWTFVIWGGLHGAYLTVNHMFNSMVKGSGFETGLSSLPVRFLGWALTFFAVCFAWIFFRAENLEAANNVVRGFLGFNGVNIPPGLNVFLDLPPKFATKTPAASSLFTDGSQWRTLVEAICFTLLGLVVAFSQTKERGSQRARLIAVVVVIGFVIQAIFFGVASEEFIYFQF